MRIETVDPRELSEGLDAKTYWRVFCSFLDLSPEEFQEVQNDLLMDQVRAMAPTPLGQHLFWGTIPRDPHEFRLRVPLTSYHDYLPFLCDNSSVFSPERISFWARGFLSGNAYKRVPYTEGATRALLHSLFAALILSSATAKGEVLVRKGDRVLAGCRGRPWLDGNVAWGLWATDLFQMACPFEGAGYRPLRARLGAELREALGEGVDFVLGAGSLLTRVGKEALSLSLHSPWSLSPRALRSLARLATSWVKARLGRTTALMPRHLRSPRGLVTWGADRATAAHLSELWGVQPLEVYLSLEGGVLAMAGWDKGPMTFVPHSAFLEFIPLNEAAKSRSDGSYIPPTLLLHELQPGQSYEVVISSFYGMPFMRYRLGDIVQVVSSGEGAVAGRLPKVVMASRTDEMVDLDGLARLEPSTVTDAMELVGLEVAGWAMRKEQKDGLPVVHLLVEPRGGPSDTYLLSRRLHTALKALDRGYGELESLLDARPLKVTLLAPGTFARFYRGASGQEPFDPGRPRALVNPSPEQLRRLLEVGRQSATLEAR